MKRRIALFMVLAMLISLVPMNVFAATDNTVGSVLKVADDYSFSTAATASSIRIEEKNNNEFGVAAQVIRLKLTNAEWNDFSVTAMNAYSPSASFVKLSDTEMEATLTDASVTTTDKAVFKIPMIVDVKAAGDISVTVDGRDSLVTGGTYVFATAGAGDTTTTVSSVKSFADSVVLDTIQIDENKIGAIGGAFSVKYKLPAGFKWGTQNIAAASASFGGGFTGVVAGHVTGSVVDWSSDARELVVYYNPTMGSTRGSVFLAGQSIVANSDAKVGDVAMEIKQNLDSATIFTHKVTEQSVVVAKYASYDVTVKALADPLSIYAGDMDAASDSAQDMNKLVEMTIKEEVAGSWLAGRRTVIEFPNTAKILGVDLTKLDKIGNVSIEGANYTTTGYKALNNKNLSKIELIHTKTAGAAATDKMELKMKFYVSVDASFTGDLAAKVYGSAMTKENSVVLGKVAAPVAMTSSKKDVKIGLQNQPIADIVITEPAKGVWDSKSDGTEYLDVKLPTGFVWKTVPTVKVTKGDVTLLTNDIKDVTDQTLRIPVKYSSTVASELTLTGGTVTLDRNVPEGEFKLKVGGTSVVDNNNAAATWCTFDSSNVVSFVNFNVITPAPGDTKTISKVVFTIDSMDYMVGDVKVTGDVAPFINAQSRTMLPLRALANALNVSNDNIVWNESDRSVVIFKGDATIKVVIGEMKFTKNGTEVGMDTMAVIKDGRTMLPLRAIGQALGFTPVWDEATRTVTVQ